MVKLAVVATRIPWQSCKKQLAAARSIPALPAKANLRKSAEKSAKSEGRLTVSQSS
jgi:hypothetical protein